jgi:hypothetical protein
MNNFWRSPAMLAHVGSLLPLIAADHLTAAMEAAWEDCVMLDDPPDLILCGDEVYHAWIEHLDKRRSRSHARKTRRERLARCAVGQHAWADEVDICLACYTTREEFVDQQPEAACSQS